MNFIPILNKNRTYIHRKILINNDLS